MSRIASTVAAYRVGEILAILVAGLVAAAFLTSAAYGAGSLAVQGVTTKQYPAVTVRLTPPAGTQAPVASGVEVRENGVDAKDVAIRSTGGSREALAVVLLVDTSGSMKGRPLEDARDAARRFVAALGTGDRVSLVTFDSKPTIVVPLTADRARLAAGIDGLAASGETALYDGLRTAADVAAKAPTKGRSIVLLSDGGDTVSIGTADQAYSAIRSTRVPLYAVALESPEYNGALLSKLVASASGRFVPLKDSANLAKSFEGIAEELQAQWEVSFRSARPATKDIDLDIAVRTSDGKRFEVSTVYQNPNAVPLPMIETFRVRTPSPLPLAGFGLTAFLSAALAVLFLGLVFARQPSTLQQVRLYANDTAAQEASDDGGITGKMIEAVDYVAGKRGFIELLHQKLDRAGLPLRPAEYIFFHVLAVIILGIVGQAAFRSTGLTGLIVLVATVGPILMLEIAIDRRRRKFEEQLPDVLNLISGSLRAGYGLLQAVDLVVQEMLPPSSVEFRRVQTEARLGLSVEAALEKMADRVDSENFRWTVSAINIQREVGGNLAEVLDIVATTIRDRDALQRQMKALTSEGKLSAIILSVLPFAEAGVLAAVNPHYIGQLTGSPLGLLLLAGAFALWLVGLVWLRSVVRIEV
jgi:tight adherence protein B